MTDENVHHNNNNNTHDESWENFVQEHEQDLQDIENSHSAHRFERHAQRQENKKLMQELRDNTRTAGPRDFTNSSWLQTDSIMDQLGDDFIEPNPTFSYSNKPLILYTILFIISIVGVIVSVLFPAYTAIIGSLSALIFLLAGAGLLAQLRNKKPRTPFDDGARV